MTGKDDIYKIASIRRAYGRCRTKEDHLTMHLMINRNHHQKKHHRNPAEEDPIEMVQIPLYKEGRIIGYEWG